jgi:hypothetical protein
VIRGADFPFGRPHAKIDGNQRSATERRPHLETDVHLTQNAALRTIFAGITSANTDAFDAEQLTITARPAHVGWPFVALIVGFGTGTVMCVEERFIDWARENAPAHPDRAGYLVGALASEGARRGETLHPMPPWLGWALAEEPPAPPVPAGYRLERVDRDWMNEWQRRDAFTNALGTSDQVHRTFRNQFAHVLFDERREPAAVAGVFDTEGLSEIGVDVVPGARGRNLAPVVVSAAAPEILHSAGTAFYGSAVTNIRSQRTALASGFLPACSLAVVIPAGVGMADG